jgi:hypothetical protein
MSTPLLPDALPEVRGNCIALGCPINHVLDFGGHFLSLGWDSFFKRGSFSTATPVFDTYCSDMANVEIRTR